MVNEIRMVSIVARTNRMFFFIFSCWNLTRKSKLTWILRGPILFLHIVSYEFVNNNDILNIYCVKGQVVYLFKGQFSANMIYLQVI